MLDPPLPPPPDRRRWWFTAPQRRAGGIVVLVGTAFVGLLHLRSSTYVPDPMPATGALAHQLGDRLDPNTAPAQELEALPGLGPSKAAAIVAFREQHGGRPFEFAEDLRRVSGIGPALLERMRPHLSLPAQKATKNEAATEDAGREQMQAEQSTPDSDDGEQSDDQ